jgi:Uma2 family endonuclease
MATVPNPKIVTYEEWLEMPVVEDRIEEVVDGQIILMPPAKTPHLYIIDWLIDEFKRQLDRKLYGVFTGSFGLVIREKPLTCRNPDVVVFERATVVEKDGYFRSPPQLAIEVLSPSETRRLTARKLEDYASIGVPEVWVFGPQTQTVEILYLDSGRLVTSAILRDGVLKPRAFPHVQVDIATVWPD